MRPNFYNQAPRYHTAHSPYNLIDRICTPTTRDTILAGDMYHFGTKNWLVIERQENKLLLLATEVIDLHAFHKKAQDVTWAESDLRKWLNTKLFKQIFNKKEQALIEPTLLSNPRIDGKPDDPQTTDSVFLLSVEEAKKYFGIRDYYTAPYMGNWVNSLGLCGAEPHLESYHNYFIDDFLRSYSYYLRTPGLASNTVSVITHGELMLSDGDSCNITVTSKYGIRPAIWVRLP